MFVCVRMGGSGNGRIQRANGVVNIKAVCSFLFLSQMQLNRLDSSAVAVSRLAGYLSI